MIQILATFGDQNLQVLLWSDLEENISGNQLLGHLNIVPATVFLISCYFWRIEIALTAQIRLNFLRYSELYSLEISVMGGSRASRLRYIYLFYLLLLLIS